MNEQERAQPQEPDQEPVPSQEPVQKRGRPEEKEWPEPIPDSPENIARALMAAPPKGDKNWRYLKKHRNRRSS